jgi:hypothetical protein
MAFTLATGTQAAIASAYGSSVNITAASNAANCVITAAGLGAAVNDIVELTNGWDLSTGRLFRVSNVATNDFTLEGLNTTSTVNYPAGAGTGTARRITTWTPITQIQGIDTSGGDQQFADITTIVDRIQKQIPTIRSPQEISLTIFDDPALSWYPFVVAASDGSVPAGLRFIFPNGSRLVANGYWSLQKTPTVAVNAPLTANISFSALAEPTRYAT